MCRVAHRLPMAGGLLSDEITVEKLSPYAGYDVRPRRRALEGVGSLSAESGDCRRYLALISSRGTLCSYNCAPVSTGRDARRISGA
jgi:hypothetical protein